MLDLVELCSIATLIYVAIPLITCLLLLRTSLIVDDVSRRHCMITGYVFPKILRIYNKFN